MLYLLTVVILWSSSGGDRPIGGIVEVGMIGHVCRYSRKLCRTMHGRTLLFERVSEMQKLVVVTAAPGEVLQSVTSVGREHCVTVTVTGLLPALLLLLRYTPHSRNSWTIRDFE